MKPKSSVYLALIVICLLGFVGLVLVGLQFTISIEPIPEPSPLPKKVPPPLFSTPVSKPKQPKQNTPLDNPTSTSVTTGTGALRISNQTDQPVRVALLTKPSTNSTYAEPAHWDFAPGEGSRQGLILSLPNGNLKLKQGDILVGFAQDGSRRYWGPYVVGETASPIWNSKASEWQLILQR